MKNHTEVEPHVGAPDSPGWWLVQLPTREPYLMLVTEGETPAVAQAWQDGFKCWPLEEVADVARLGDVLSGLAARPRLLWDIVCAFNQVQVAGPWQEGEDGIGPFIGRPKVGGGDPGSAGSHHAVVRTRPDEDDPPWSCSVNGTQRNAATQDEAKATADRMLRGRGFFVIDT